MDVQSLKVLAIFCLTLIALIFGIIPLYCIWRYKDSDQTGNSKVEMCFSFMNAFAGGVFMSIALLHLLPEVRSILEEAFIDMGKPYEYAWAELVASIGFFFIAFLENLVEICNEKLGGTNGEEERLAFASSSCQLYTSQLDNEEIAIKEVREETNLDRTKSLISDREHNATDDRHTFLRAFILLLTLSVHSVFEGLSIGLQGTKDGVLELFIAVAIHKGIEAMGVSIGVAKSEISTVIKLICMALFSVMSPIGIVVGMLITNEGSSDGLVTGILQGLATGTFLFITFIDILPHELKSKEHRLLKLLSVLIGFAVIAAIQTM